MTATFEALVAEAAATPFAGWDFSFIEGRMESEALPWDYEARARALLPEADALLDMGTGGGELLSSLQPLPPTTYASEGYPPNVPVARARLAPLGVEVVYVADDENLPLRSGFFDLVLDRHAFFVASEVARVLRPGGRLLTQQVGERNMEGLYQLLTGMGKEPRRPRLHKAVSFVEAAGMRVTVAEEALVETRFRDVGALVYFLRAVPWFVPDFSIEAYGGKLRELHEQIQLNGPLVVHDHRFTIEAEKV